MRATKKSAPGPIAPRRPSTPPRPLDGGLDAAERQLLAEALRRAEEARDAMDDALVAFGRWLLVHVFRDDAAAALSDRRRDNRLWRDLLARAGGPTLRLSERVLYVALHIAAYDKRITDEAWRALEPGRKALLLPLGDEGALRKAARHVTAMKLTQRATRAYVAALRAERGEGTAPRLTPSRIAAHLRGLRERVGAAGYQRKALAVLRKGDVAAVASVRREVESLRAWADDFLAKMA